MPIDPKLLEELEERRKRIIISGGQDKIDKRHANGDWTARERMDFLFDSGSFTEIGMGHIADGNYWTQMFIG